MVLEEGEILLTLDGSTSSEAAVLPALQLTRVYGAPLRVLTVVDLDPAAHAPSSGTPGDRFERYARDLLVRAGGIDVVFEAELAFGPAAPTILEQAAGVRVVVMATHGRGGFHASFIGSVTDKVVRSARLPVLTVPVQGQTNLMAGPVVVGLDGSEEAEAGLPVARDLAGRLGVGVALVRAYAPMLATGSEFVAYEYDAVGILKEAAEEYLKSTVRPSEQAVAVLASPAAAIEDTAQKLGAGLVVLTTHGRGLAHRLALGSTTDRVLHSVRHPLLVIPRSDR